MELGSNRVKDTKNLLTQALDGIVSSRRIRKVEVMRSLQVSTYETKSLILGVSRPIRDEISRDTKCRTLIDNSSNSTRHQQF